jgi:glutathione S-transferase
MSTLYHCMSARSPDPVLRYGRHEAAERKQPQVVEAYTRWFLSKLRTLNSSLERAQFLCADRITAADVSVGYALLLADDFGLAPRFKPVVLVYWRRLQWREELQRALAAQAQAAREQGVPLLDVAHLDGFVAAPACQAPFSLSRNGSLSRSPKSCR